MKRALLVGIAAVALGTGVMVQAQVPRSAEAQMKAAQQKAEVEGDLKGAIEEYKKVIAAAGSNRALAAEALLRMAGCYQKLGVTEAQTIYERVLRDFGDQREAAATARTQLAVLQPVVPQRQQNARQLWTGLPNELRSLRPSLDGRYLSFTDIETGNVAIRDAATGTDRLLSDTADWFSEYSDAAVISPDGRQVAYTWYIHKENKVELRVASMTNVEPVRPQVVLRVDLNEAAYQIAWMPDGKELVVTRSLSNRTSQIGKVTIRDGSFRSIKSLEWRQPGVLSLSPDGRYVAYDVPSGEAGSPLDILVLATDGSRETVVVKNPANDAFPLWTPDGSRLVFLSDRSGTNDLWTIAIEDGRPNGAAEMLKSNVGAIRLLGMTKAGTLYYFQPPDTRRNLFIAPLDAIVSATTLLPATERVVHDNVGPAWSRDGEYLAYYSFRNISADRSSGVLVIRTLKTGDERTVPLPTRVTSRFGAGPKWFPDNRSVLIESGDAEGPGFGFYRLALDTGNTELLTRLPRDVASYDLAPDGRTIIYAVFTGDDQKLMRVDVENHRETELRSAAVTESGSEIIALALSADGTQLATTLIGGVVEVRPAAGGEPREVFRPAVRELGTGPMRQALTWTPDGRFLLFVRGADPSLWRVPAAGGQAEKVGRQTPGIAVHPDGKRIVFSSVAAPSPSKVWVFESLLPAQRATR